MLAPYPKPWDSWVGRAALIKQQMRNLRLRLFLMPLFYVELATTTRYSCFNIPVETISPPYLIISYFDPLFIITK